jgi:hypothetical protein
MVAMGWVGECLPMWWWWRSEGRRGGKLRWRRMTMRHGSDVVVGERKVG